MNQLVLIVVCLAAVSCSRVIEQQNSDVSRGDGNYPELSCPELEGTIQVGDATAVTFENVSFRRGFAWIRDVEYFITPECILTSEDFKPDGIGGRTKHLKLRYASSNDEAHISVFKIEDYKKAFARYPQYLENRDAGLKAIIADSGSLKSYGLDPPPHLMWMDAGELLYAKARVIDFLGGRGLLTVTYITQDAFITISNHQLQFLFQGFTADGEYFVEMDFPARLNGLPDEPEEFHSSVGSRSHTYNSPEHVAAYEKYILKTAALIDKAPNSAFRPNLHQVEKFIRGFEVRSDE